MESIKVALSSESARNKGTHHIPLLTLNLPNHNQSFKERNSLSERIAAVENIRLKFPQKVPVIVEKYKKVSYGIIIHSKLKYLDRLLQTA